MKIEDVFVAAILIGLIIVAGKVVRLHVGILRRLFLPSSLVGGMLAMLLGPQALGWVMTAWQGEEAALAGGLWPRPVMEVWAEMPKILISVVFAGLFLGKVIPNPIQIWRRAGPMVAHGQTLAWGQYVVGLSLVVLLLTPLWGVSPLAGALIEISFEGGHGTAAGLAATFAELGFEDGADLALGMATVGVIMAVILGTVMINYGVARGHLPRPESPEDRVEQVAESDELAEHDDREPVRPPARLRDQTIDPLSVHLGLIAMAIGVGWLILEGMILVENTLLVPLGWPELMRHIPLFPLAMIGGVVVQIGAARIGWADRIDRELMNRISGTALDVLIVAAMASISISALGAHFWVFLLLCLAGIAWNIFGLLVLAPRMFPANWMQSGLANFGQGMGMTVIGLLLVRMSDPKDKTGTMESFGYKQLLFEPIVGGGLFTAASLPLIAEFGPIPVLIGVTIMMCFWLTLGIWLFHPKRAG